MLIGSVQKSVEFMRAVGPLVINWFIAFWAYRNLYCWAVEKYDIAFPTAKFIIPVSAWLKMDFFHNICKRFTYI